MPRGNPNALAALEAGEVVLDLGSGGGFDVFIAARKVGATGRAIGVDMTPEMLSGLEFGRGSQVNVPIGVLLWLMIYPMMLKRMKI